MLTNATAGALEEVFVSRNRYDGDSGIDRMPPRRRPPHAIRRGGALPLGGPISRFLTGTQGTAPSNGFDPMAFVIDECHKRAMEFHAWVNPYRVQLNISSKLAPSHVYYQHPEWFVVYGNQRFFNPGLPQCREFINKVIKDIVSRYDVDAIHMDDYFYPYPIAGKEFPDEEAFQAYGIPDGFGDQSQISL